jgi:hypothetical protein
VGGDAFHLVAVSRQTTIQHSISPFAPRRWPVI